MSSELNTTFMSKNTLHELGTVATELRSIDPTIQIISYLNEAQKLIAEIEKLDKDLTTAGFLKKRGIKKAVSQKREKYSKATETLLNNVLGGYRRIYFDLAKDIKEIAKFIPQETETIRNLQIPGLEVNAILTFSAKVLTVHNQISEVLKGSSTSRRKSV